MKAIIVSVVLMVLAVAPVPVSALEIGWAIIQNRRIIQRPVHRISGLHHNT